ncbi:MAG: hypothetical protein ACJA0U_000330 [Salibacteraceae bacterium]|jgi:hypothetical protein
MHIKSLLILFIVTSLEYGVYGQVPVNNSLVGKYVSEIHSMPDSTGTESAVSTIIIDSNMVVSKKTLLIYGFDSYSG